MSSTRLTSAAVFVAVSGGLVLLATGESWPLVVLGALLVAGGAILMARHFWRESDKKRKQELASQHRALAVEIAGLSDLVATTRAETGYDVGEVVTRIDVFTQGVLEYMAQLELDLAKVDSRLGQIATSDEMLKLQKRFDTSDRLIQRNREHAVTQVSAVLSLYHLFKPGAPYPPFGGWAIGGDSAYRLVNLILDTRPTWIIEMGSGLSTILAGQALDLIGGDGQIISLEHDQKWLDRTQSMVSEHNVSHRSQIVHAPLVDTKIGEEVFSWYDLSNVDLPEETQIMFIDGPPEQTGSLARYPAVPMLYDRLSNGGVILMDDANRPAERGAVERWTQEYPDLNARYYNDSKGTVEIIKGNE